MFEFSYDDISTEFCSPLSHYRQLSASLISNDLSISFSGYVLYLVTHKQILCSANRFLFYFLSAFFLN